MRETTRICRNCGWNRPADTFQGDLCAMCSKPEPKPVSFRSSTHQRWKAAQGRALRRLGREYPERYHELLEEEKARE